MLEITETVMMSALETVEQTLSGLRALGVGLSVDDFGTVYSSLTFLARQSVDELKIDRSFISTLTQSAESRAIVQSVIDLAKAFRLNVVAEGIETPAQADLLRMAGCESAQGFLFSRPVPAGDIDAVLQVTCKELQPVPSPRAGSDAVSPQPAYAVNHLAS